MTTTVPLPALVEVGTDPSARVHVIVRVFDAPRALVFRAWTEPAMLMAWWGPYGCTNPVCAIDLRVGGRWHVVMQSPEGVDHPIDAVIQEVRVPELLVFLMDLSGHPAERHPVMGKAHGLGDEVPTGRILTTVLFEELDGLTRLTMRQTFATAEERHAHLRVGSREGWGQSFDSLEELLIHGL